MSAAQKIVPLVKRNRKDLEGHRIRPFDGGLLQPPGQPEEQLTRYHVITERIDDRESFWKAVEMYHAGTETPLVLPSQSDGNIRVNLHVKNALLILKCIAKAAHVSLRRGWEFE